MNAINDVGSIIEPREGNTMSVATMDQLQGLADGTVVFVRQVAAQVNGVEFVKREEGLERMNSVVPFRLFTGAVEQGLVTDHTNEPPPAGSWWQRSHWLYYIVSSTPDEVRYILFQGGRLYRHGDYPLGVRTRTVRQWLTSGQPKVRVTDPAEYPEALFSFDTVATLCAQLGDTEARAIALRTEARDNREAARQADRLRARLNQIAGIAQQ